MSQIEHPMLLRAPPDVAAILRDNCRNNTAIPIGIDIHPGK